MRIHSNVEFNEWIGQAGSKAAAMMRQGNKPMGAELPAAPTVVVKEIKVNQVDRNIAQLRANKDGGGSIPGANGRGVRSHDVFRMMCFPCCSRFRISCSVFVFSSCVLSAMHVRSIDRSIDGSDRSVDPTFLVPCSPPTHAPIHERLAHCVHAQPNPGDFATVPSVPNNNAPGGGMAVGGGGQGSFMMSMPPGPPLPSNGIMLGVYSAEVPDGGAAAAAG